MSNGIRLFATNSSLEFARRSALLVGEKLHEPGFSDARGRQVNFLSNDNFLVDIKVNVRGYHCFIFATQAQDYYAHLGKDETNQDVWGTKKLGANDSLMELFMMIDALKRAEAEEVTVILPYMPYIRSDQVDHPRVSLGAKVVARFLMDVGADRVLLLDPHFRQLPGFFDKDRTKVAILKAKPIFVRFIRANAELFHLDNAVVIAPDMNEAKHAGAVAAMLGLPIAVIDKRRVGDNEKAVPFALMGDVKGKHGLLFDDETASCSTILGTVDYCAGFGLLSVSSFITHLVLSKLAGVRKFAEHPLNRFLVGTDSIPVSEAKRAILGEKLMIATVDAFVAGAIKTLFSRTSLDEYKRSCYDGLSTT